MNNLLDEEVKKVLSHNGYPTFSELEFKNRHDKLRKIMEEKGIDARVFAASIANHSNR